MDFLTKGLHRTIARRTAKPIDVTQVQSRILNRSGRISGPDARQIAELIDDGVDAARELTRQGAEEPIDPETVPENPYSAEQLPLGDRYTIEVEVDVFDEDGDQIMTLPISTYMAEGDSIEDVEAYADEVVEGYYRQSPTMFGGSDISQVNTVKRSIVYAERAF